MAELLDRGKAGGRYMMAQKLHLADSKNTLVQVNGKAMISAELMDLLHMILMGNQTRRKNENII